MPTAVTIHGGSYFSSILRGGRGGNENERKRIYLQYLRKKISRAPAGGLHAQALRDDDGHDRTAADRGREGIARLAQPVVRWALHPPNVGSNPPAHI